MIDLRYNNKKFRGCYIGDVLIKVGLVQTRFSDGVHISYILLGLVKPINET